MDLEKLKGKKLSELSVSEMRIIAQGEGRKEEIKLWLHSRIYNKFSVYQTFLFLYLGFSANAVSYLWIFLGIISTLLLWFGQYWTNILYFITLCITCFIDYSDGEIARYWKWRTGKKSYSLKGLYLEGISHFIIRTFIFLGIGIGAWARFNQIYYFYAGVALTIILLLDQILKLRESEAIIERGDLKLLKRAREEKLSSPKWLGKIANLFKPQTMLYSLFFWTLIFNVLHWFLILSLIMVGLLFIKDCHDVLKRLDNLNKKASK